jgi:hypothetical protein
MVLLKMLYHTLAPGSAVSTNARTWEKELFSARQGGSSG